MAGSLSRGGKVPCSEESGVLGAQYVSTGPSRTPGSPGFPKSQRVPGSACLCPHLSGLPVKGTGPRRVARGSWPEVAERTQSEGKIYPSGEGNRLPLSFQLLLGKVCFSWVVVGRPQFPTWFLPGSRGILREGGPLDCPHSGKLGAGKCRS